MLLESVYRKILLEGSRDNLLLPVMQQYGINMSLSQFKQVMLRKLAMAGIRNLSLGGNFYLLGAIMYYLNGDLTENTPAIFDQNRSDNPDEWKDVFKREICIRLNALILILRNSYIDSLGSNMEQPEDFGSLPLNKLLKKYNSKINKALGITKNNKEGFLTSDTTAGQNYTYEIITSYKQCTKYQKYTDWCVTWGEQHYNGYTIEARNDAGKPAHFIIFKMNGFENVPCVKEPEKWIDDPNYAYPKPQDTYGNSLIALLQDNASPDPIYITSRWNHGDGSTVGDCEADHAYSTDEFLNIIGCDSSIFTKVYNEWATQTGAEANSNSRMEKMNYLRKFKYAQMCINNGNTVENIFGKKIKPLATGKKGRVTTALVYVTPDENSTNAYISFYDRGKIYYDDYLIKYDNMWRADCLDYFLSSYKGMDNPIMLTAGGYGKPLSIYSPKFRKFLNLGGITSFPKYDYSLANGDVNDRKYKTIGMTSSQVAIIDMEKLEPAVVADNGSPWFEDIQFMWEDSQKKSRKNKYTYLVEIYNNDYRQLLLTYDSAANEKYIFDIKTGTYSNVADATDIADGFNLETEYAGSDKRLPGHVLLTRINEEHYSWVDEVYRTTSYAYFNLATKQLLTIGGYNVFSDVKYHSNVVGVTIDKFTYGEDARYQCFYHDLKIGKDITLNGEPLLVKNFFVYLDEIGHEYADDYFRPGTLYVAIGTENGWKHCFIYNPITHSLLSHNGEYLFDTGGYEDRRKGHLIAADGSEITLTTPEKDAVKHEYAMQQAAENFKRKFATLLEQMNKYNSNLY